MLGGLALPSGGGGLDTAVIVTAVNDYLTDNPPPPAGPGSVTNTQLAPMPEATFKGRLLGSGSGSPVDMTATQARTALGLGTIATQSAGSVAITGGTIGGITDLAIADGGTGASTAAVARSNLGAADAVHTHNGSDINAGTIATARLGSGTADATTFLRGDQTWAVPAGGGGGATNLTIARTGTTVTVLSDTGTDAALPAADGTNAGVMTAADRTKLDGIEALATADQTAAEIQAAYDTQVALASQAEAEAGTSTATRRWTPQRVSQAIAALAPTGGGALPSQPQATLLGRAAGAGTGTGTALTPTQSRAVLALAKRPQDYGAFADGTSRPVSQWFTGGALDRGYANLAALQVDYPHVSSTTDEIDWAAGQAAIAAANEVFFPAGIYRINKPFRSKHNLRCYGEGPSTVLRNPGAGSTQTASCITIGAHHPTVWNPSNAWAHIIYPAASLTARTVTFAAGGAAANFTAGEWVWLRSREYEAQSSGNFIPEFLQLNQIVSVDTGANSVTLRDPPDEILDNPAIAKFSSTADPTKVDPSTGASWAAVENVIWEHMALDSAIGLSDRTCCYNSIIRNLKFINNENAIVVNCLTKSIIEDCDGTFSDRAIEIKNGASDLTIRRVNLSYRDAGNVITIPILNTGENVRNIIFDRVNIFCGSDFSANVRMVALNQRGGGVYNSKFTRTADSITTEMYALGTSANFKYGTERVEIKYNEFVAGAGTNAFHSIGVLNSTSASALAPPSGCAIGPNKHVGGSPTAVGGTHAITRGFQREANRIYPSSGPTAITYSSTQQPPIPMADELMPSTGITNIKVAENGWNLPSQASNTVGFKARGRRIAINGGNGSARIVFSGGNGQFDAWREQGTGYIVCRPGFSLRPSSGITWTQVGGTSEYYAPRTAATGTFTFTAQPADHAGIYVNGTRFTFVPNGTAAVGEFQIQKGTTLALSITAAATVLNACTDARVSQATYTATSGTVLTVTHDTAGTDGNRFTLGRQTAGFVANAGVSASTLTGGTGPSVTALPARVFDGDGSDAATNDEIYESGVVGSLASGKYGYGDPAALGYSTIVLRMRDDVDPDTRAQDEVRWVPGGVTIEAATAVTTGGGTGAVNSVFGRAGDVEAASGDYSADLISAAGTATNYTPASSDIGGHLVGIDSALGTGPTLTANQYAAANSAGTAGEARTDKRPWMFAAPITANGTYPIALWGDVPVTHSQISAVTMGGSCSIKIQKGGADINGFAAAVALTTARVDTTSTETFAANALVTLVVSAASGLTGLCVTGKATRTGN